MLLTITGDIGAGKSTVAKLLANKLNLDVIETGDIYRKYAGAKGLSVLEQNKTDDWEIDRRIDAEISELGKTATNTIFVSRMAWMTIPTAIHIYMKIDPELAAKRIFASKGRVAESHSDWRETLEYNKSRNKLEMDRYKSMYSLSDPSGESAANIVIDIGSKTPDEIANAIHRIIISKEYGYYVDPLTIFPTRPIRKMQSGLINSFSETIKSGDCVSIAAIEQYKKKYYACIDDEKIAMSARNRVPFVKVKTVINIKEEPEVKTIYDYEDLIQYRLHA